MLDIKLIRENPEKINELLSRKKKTKNIKQKKVVKNKIQKKKKVN